MTQPAQSERVMDSTQSADMFPSDAAHELPAPPRALDLRTEFLKERYNLPPEWQWYAFEALDYPALQFAQFKGGVYPFVVTKGKRKGDTDYRKPAPGSEATVVLSEAEFRPWLIQWEGRTGKCHKCQGTGQQWASWSADKGSAFRDCSRCNATGLAQVQP